MKNILKLKRCLKCGKEKQNSEFYRKYRGGSSLWCKLCFRDAIEEYKKEHPEIVKKMNKELKTNDFKNERLNNLIRLKIHQNKSNQKRLSILNGYINKRMCSAIGGSLHGSKKFNHWETLVGYMVEDLKKHLELQFTDGMSWKNYGIKGWHIDHKIPQSRFHYEKPEDEGFKRCWALSNLQPLWATDNMIKHDKTMEEWNRYKLLLK